MSDAFVQLHQRLATIHDINASANVLEWDLETYMPEGGAEARSGQVATLRRLAHELFTDDITARLMDDAGRDGFAPESFEEGVLRVARRDLERAQRIPSSLVANLADATSHARLAWKSAREQNRFSVFAPHLARVIELTRQKAEAVGYADHPYDALLDEYEPGMRAAEITTLFSTLREGLVPLVRDIAREPEPDVSFLTGPFSREAQWDFGLGVAVDFGYDLQRGRQDYSAHPFTTSFSPTDVRITTRIDERYFPTGFFGTLHETGHALYEQGINPEYRRTPLADGTSLGMHESQSRLWENLVGRSLPFWEHYYPILQQLFSEVLTRVDLPSFYRAINRVHPSLIRVEADEVTYNLHIMIRFELEMQVFEGALNVEDLPSAWNDLTASYLGLHPSTEAEGVLQDVHWSIGALGYFPTYTLGNLMSVQLMDQIRRDVPNLDDDLREGRFQRLLAWLREHVHGYGRMLTATDLLHRATGSRLDSAPWLSYIKRKYGALYSL